MAIVIPSKHIYSKSFDPVIDNNIDKVEVGVKEPSNIVENEPVAESVSTAFYSGNSSNSSAVTNRLVSGTGTNVYNTEVGVYIGIDNIKYTNFTIQINQIQNNKFIQKIVTGLSQSGEPNIGYTLYGNYEKGNVGGTMDVGRQDSSTLNIASTSFTFNKTYEREDEPYTIAFSNDIANVETDKDNILTTTLTYSANNGLATAKTELIFYDQSTIISAEPSISITSDGNKIFNIDFSLLSGLRWYAVKGVASFYGGNLLQTLTVVNNSSKYEMFVPKKAEVTINGVVLKLNLEDKTIKIGNGNKVFSFDGNELIQITNTPSIESKYQVVVDKWKSGKQTAVISCPIADYYDEEGSIAVSAKGIYTYENPYKMTLVQKVSPTTYYVVFSNEGGGVHLPPGDIVYYENEGGFIVDEVRSPESDEISVDANGKISNLLDTKGELIVNHDEPPKYIPMTFQEEDIVIPYTYTNKGDKPLSYNKDFTPKKFKVVGVGISKKQGGAQELTLQEV